jgi:hypothetical protein
MIDMICGFDNIMWTANSTTLERTHVRLVILNADIR